jgi:hypothetical protein
LLDDRDRCFRRPEVAVETRTVAFQPFRTRSELGNARSDPGFQLLLKKINLA